MPSYADRGGSVPATGLGLRPSDDELLAAAVEYAQHHWQIIPLYGKIPAIPTAHSAGVSSDCCVVPPVPPDPLRGKCKGGCGRLGHGYYDATDDVDAVVGWWSGRYKSRNIGAQIPESMLLIDIDPRHGGDRSWAALERRYSPFPEGLMTITGRGDGGVHLYVRRPRGRLSVQHLGPGIELKVWPSGGVQAPSAHPDTGGRYIRVEGPIPAAPDWFIDLVTVAAPQGPRRRRWPGKRGRSVADDFCASVSWRQVLEPHGWECLDYDGDEDGARWCHPDATSSCSATVRYDGELLFVYSTSTAFEPTSPGDPHGYTKFRAYAVLDHHGDMSAAAKALLRKGSAE